MRTLIILVLAVFTLAGASVAAMRHVPADYSTIQSAIVAAQNHDTVLVAPGTYAENINFRGKNIVVASNYLTTGDVAYIRSTIIDGSSPVDDDSASVVLIISNEDSTAELAGFTLTGGTGTLFRDQSDGLIYCEGGALLIEAAMPWIHHNYLNLNEATRRPAGTQSAGGGGIRAGFTSSVRITNNVISECDGRYGGGVVLFFARAELDNNIIVQNRGGQDYGGAGVWVGGNSNVNLHNNLICSNNSSGSQAGGGVRVFGGNVYGTNNILWANLAQTQAQIAPPGNTARFTYSSVQGGYTGIGNLSTYPLLADSFFTLLASSPCIDSGNDSARYNDPDGSRSDIGPFGGPRATLLTYPYPSPTIYTQNGALDFGPVPSGTEGRAARAILNRGTMGLQIDSTTLAVGVSELSVTTAPAWLGPFQADSLVMTWNPSSDTPLADTVLIYHRDSASQNPIRIPVRGSVLAADAPDPVTNTFELAQNFPNPFNSSTEIRFSLPTAATASVEIFDMQGRFVAQLVADKLTAGTHVVTWNATTAATGLYLCRLHAGAQFAYRKLLLLK